MPPNEAPPATLNAAITVFEFDRPVIREDQRLIPVEIAVNVLYGGLPFAVMMMSPGDFEDFAVGFSLTEGIAAEAADIRNVRIVPQGDDMQLEIDLAPDRLRRHLGRQRAMKGRTSCGVCGVEDLAVLHQATPQVAAPQAIPLQAIRRALRALDQAQILNRATHAVHAAAWADISGNVSHVREDVGRHNALDKLIGALVRAEIDPANGMIIITSRCSFEMIEKSATFGAGTVVAISAPTSLAVERARALGVTLIALARHDSVTFFEGIPPVAEQAVEAERAA